MAITEAGSRLQPIVDAIARGSVRYGVREGDPAGARALMRVVVEQGVRRVVQMYWTPFQVEISGTCIGLYLDIHEPRPHWTECYLSPDQRNWVLCFRERDDGDVELTYYRDYETVADAVEGFFSLSGWYVLTATDKTWDDVVAQIQDGIGWSVGRETLAVTTTHPGLQESLKKSTIVWLRWDDDGIERTMPVWYLWDQKAQKMYVISGERNQMLPGAERMRRCELIFRQKGKNVRVGEVAADVRVLPPGDQWNEVAEKIAEKRLNIPGLPEDTARRWRDECVILELTLRG